jgi:hypothetical protein
MNTDSSLIVQQIREQFELLLASVLGSDEIRSADEFERNLFRDLMQLGRQMLTAFFLAQAEKLRHVEAVVVNGQALPLHGLRRRTLRSVFGMVRFRRGYYYQAGKGKGHFLLDARLNLPTKRTTDMLREWALWLSCNDPYHRSVKTLLGMLGHNQSARAIEADMREDAKRVKEFYDKAPAPKAADEGPILVAQADGKGVPMLASESPNKDKARRAKGDKASRKKEAIVTTAYTIDPSDRTPEQVADSLFKVKVVYAGGRSGPRNKKVWATLKGKAVAIENLAQTVTARTGDHIKARVALTDGSEPLQKQMLDKLVGFTLVLDIIHAAEYMWEAGNSLHGETSPKREPWVKDRVLRMLRGETSQIIDEFRQLADAPRRTKRANRTLLAVAAYYERNLAHMRYNEYLSAGWPIATGVIEGACRHLVKDRCELSGMRWTVDGAEAVLNLRSVSENGDWDTFHTYRKKCRLKETYGASGSDYESLEQAAAGSTSSTLLAA